jgi:FlaG/FlaF family flagellin (archaellin)
MTPVAGILLSVCITFLLAGTSAAFVMGMDSEGVQQSAPTVKVDFDYTAGDATGVDDGLDIVHNAGGHLDPDRTFVDVKGATCTGASTPNGRYNAMEDFGLHQDIAAGMTLALDGDIPAATGSDDPCPSGTLRLDGATVSVVWRSPDGTRSHSVGTWTAPGG